jgi:hypothetical protein
MVSRIIVGMWMVALPGLGQTRIDLGNQGKAPDFGAKAHTRPMQTGSVLPATCSLGELFFNSSANSGQNIYGCTATNIWQVMGGLGQCVVSDSMLTCAGGMVTGDGSRAGEIQLYEKNSSGADYASWMAPDSLMETYRLQMPGSGPGSGQILSFGAPVNGTAAGLWIAEKTKMTDTMFFPAAQKNGAAGWVAGPNWSISGGSNGAAVSGAGVAPFATGYLSFSAGAKTYAVLQVLLPGNWDRQGVAAKLLWAANSAATGSTVTWEIAAQCAADGESLLNPSFPAARQSVVPVPYPADTTSRRITTTFSPLALSGCAPNSMVYLLLDRDGTVDTNLSAVSLFGLQLDIAKGLN